MHVNSLFVVFICLLCSFLGVSSAASAKSVKIFAKLQFNWI